MSATATECPTCHSKFIIMKKVFMRGGFYAECADCGERGTREHTVEQARTAWNTRAGEKA
ncbi:Lar family restriction alleviation protein [Acetobacter indonesiensis]|uniref:Restriction alleviation protein, Lar family n=1 Tax=Acetobacter indonesiensis TaxID=104101 RepID=A0A252ANJ9_9PROT|nr:Lar family restriction alleviation protein [Acetobacter indonesiensis]OUI91369.1 hypothetical protein HK17_11740 [Acetobacter indonesiensis]